MTALLAELMAPLGATTTRTRPRRARPRDSQRSKVYKTEDAFFRKHPEVHAFIGDGSIEAVQEWLDEILRQPWFLRRFGKLLRTKVVPGNGSAAWYRGKIKLTRYGRRPWYVLHELAHVVASPDWMPAHGPAFAEAYLWLVANVLGHRYAIGLTEAFDEAGVKYNLFEVEQDLYSKPDWSGYTERWKGGAT